MFRTTFALTISAALLAASIGCQSPSAGPLAPTSPATLGDFLGLGPGGSPLKATNPVPVAPVNNAVLDTLTPTLFATTSSLKYATGTLQYRFRVIDATGTTALDSGLLNGPAWPLPAPLTPTSTYTWIARVEYQGLPGPWSAASTFTTPVAPGNDFGAWESVCAGMVDQALSACVWSFVRPVNSYDDLEIAKRVAWLLRAKGAGLFLKGSGDNTVPWLGFTFSASRICFPDGHLFKIIQDAGPGGLNAPIYSDNDFVDPSTYFPARDPRLR
jgi:hypothetical protein